MSENHISKEASVLYHVLWSEVQCVWADSAWRERKEDEAEKVGGGKFIVDLDLHAKKPGYSVAIIKPLKIFELKNDRYF